MPPPDQGEKNSIPPLFQTHKYMNNVTLNMLKHCFLYCTMNELTAIMKKDPRLVLNLLIFGFGLPKKLMTPPYELSESE